MRAWVYVGLAIVADVIATSTLKVSAIAGLCLIVAGVAVLNLFSKSVAH
jgi:multidrug transporter EmrE-like cation transporter